MFDGDPVQMVQEIASRVEIKRERQRELLTARKEQGGALSNSDATELLELETEIDQLQQSLVLSITGKSTLSTLYDEPEAKTTWQEDIVDIIKPLADSLKSVTRRPRQIAELRAQLAEIDSKQSALDDALKKFSILDQAALQETAGNYLNDLREGWTDELQQLEGEELIATRQLQELLGEKEGSFSGVVPSLKRFVLGTGLTLLLATLAALQETAGNYLDDLREGWTDELQQLEGEELIATRQLQELLGEKEGSFSGVVPSLKRFVLGTGLTLLLATLAALLMYLVMRSIWWVYEKKIVSKETRRKSTLYRFSAYLYHLVTALFILLTIFIVLYVREDLLLLALASLLLAGVLLNFKQFFPRYFSEARLLLNLGSVREEERVIYNGLPWQVKSLNLHTVLHNPALDGIVRLPLSIVRDLVSRPVRNNLWFPSQRGDYIILPDGVLGRVKYQTPDLVEVTVRGGMAQTFTTADFYTLNITNLSRDESFGVAVTFGLDYSLQSISVTEIPDSLHQAITEKLNSTELGKETVSLMVELSEASASSLDYIIYGTFRKSSASSYYRIQRLVLQTCVEVSNERNWTIPFPQLTVHSA